MLIKSPSCSNSEHITQPQNLSDKHSKTDSFLSKIDEVECNFPSRIDIISFKAGQGHTATVAALKESILSRFPSTNIVVHDFFDTIRGNSLFEDIEGDTADRVYNRRFADGTLARTLKGHRSLEALDEKQRGEIWQNLFSEKFRESKPETVVSVIPVYNETIAQGLARHDPKIPYITLFTDYAIFREGANSAITTRNRHAISPSADVTNYCKSIGYSSGDIYSIPTLVSSAKPKNHSPLQIEQFKDSIGLNPKMKTVIVTAGGGGNIDFSLVADSLKTLKKYQVIFVCGKNSDAYNHLTQLQTPYNKIVFGYTDQMEKLLECSDVFIGKAGGLSITEALIKDLPMFLINDATASPLEKLNVDWLNNQGKCIALNELKDIGNQVNQLIQIKREPDISCPSNDARTQVINYISYISNPKP